jgi:AcrR family transcriptional regulator
MPNTRRDLQSRAEKSLAKRQLILESALDEFLDNGFAATRIEDIARRARVSKGSIHFHFRDKEALFEEIIRTVVGRKTGQIAADALKPEETVRAMVERNALQILPELVHGKMGKVMRLVVSEGPHFPRVLQFYFHEVIEPGLQAFRGLALLAMKRGELSNDALVRVPLLLAAPTSLILIWTSLFEHFASIDAEELVRAYLDILFGQTDQRQSRRRRPVQEA